MQVAHYLSNVDHHVSMAPRDLDAAIVVYIHNKHNRIRNGVIVFASHDHSRRRYPDLIASLLAGYVGIVDAFLDWPPTMQKQHRGFSYDKHVVVHAHRLDVFHES